MASPCQLVDLAAVAQHDHAVRIGHDLVDLGGDHQHRQAVVAQARIRRMISAWAPTSMPRVGSSRISRRGAVASQRASSTFCWLPPDSSPIGVPASGGRMSSA